MPTVVRLIDTPAYRQQFLIYWSISVNYSQYVPISPWQYAAHCKTGWHSFESCWVFDKKHVLSLQIQLCILCLQLCLLYRCTALPSASLPLLSRYSVPPILKPTKLTHLTVNADSHRCGYLPISTRAATVKVPSANTKPLFYKIPISDESVGSLANIQSISIVTLPLRDCKLSAQH